MQAWGPVEAALWCCSPLLPTASQDIPWKSNHMINPIQMMNLLSLRISIQSSKKQNYQTYLHWHYCTLTVIKLLLLLVQKNRFWVQNKPASKCPKMKCNGIPLYLYHKRPWNWLSMMKDLVASLTLFLKPKVVIVKTNSKVKAHSALTNIWTNAVWFLQWWKSPTKL